MLDMRFYKIIIITILAISFIACGDNSKPSTPLDTLKAYHLALKNKDTTTMKLLLSKSSLDIHRKEAQVQGLTLDDIVIRDTLFPADQKVFGYRKEKIDGNEASIEVKNNIGGYDAIYLLLEDRVWKIDKKTTSNQMIQDVSNPSNDFEDQIEKDRQQAEDTVNEMDSSDSNPTPDNSPTDSTNSENSNSSEIPNLPDNDLPLPNPNTIQP